MRGGSAQLTAALPYRPVSKTDRRFGRADVQQPKSRIFPILWLRAYHQHFERARQRPWLQLFTLPHAGLRRLIN